MSGELIERLREAWIQDAIDTACDGENGNTNGGDWDARWERSRLRAELSSLRGEGEGWLDIETAPRDGTWIIADGGGCDRPTPMKWNTRVGAWQCDAEMLEDWDDQAEGYSRPKRWSPIPVRSTPDSDVIGRLVGALEKIKAHANKLRNGTDDWFELVEFEGMASQALASLPDTVLPRPRRNASPSEVKTGRQGIGEV